MKRKYIPILWLFCALISLLLASPAGAAPGDFPMGVNFSLNASEDPQNVATSLQLLLLLTVLSLAPAFLVLMTCFTRIIIVLSFVRHALATPMIPPNQVLIGLALFITLFVMSPVLLEVNQQAVQPFVAGELSQQEAWDRGILPVKEFMAKQTREKDLLLFLEYTGAERPQSVADISLATLVPAYTISELKTAFQMGFLIFVPFLVIDMVVASVLMSMGMMMLPPVMISLPFKILLFVLVDGWYLVVETLLTSFH